MNKYELRLGKENIFIVINARAIMHKDNHLMVIPDLNFEFYNGELRFWSERLIQSGMQVIKLDYGKPYRKIFQMGNKASVEVTSNDQKTFSVYFKIKRCFL